MSNMPDASPNQITLDLAAFDRTSAARQALLPENTPRYTLDALYAVGKAIQISARLVPMRAELAALPGFDLAHLDRFEDLARALRYTQSELQRRVQRMKELPALAEEGYRLRGLMIAYLEVLSFKGAVAPELVQRLREGSGHRDLAGDLDVLGHELLALPPHVLDATAPVTGADVSRGAEVAHEILRRLGLVEGDLSQEALLLARQQIGALLVRSHAQLRRAIDYLRFDQGDAAELVPSLYVPGGRPPKRPEDPADALAEVHDHLHADDHAPAAPGDGPFTQE